MKPQGDSKVEGLVKLLHDANGKTKITAKIAGLKPGKYSFHMHMCGHVAKITDNAGPHLGQIGNVVARDDGTADLEVFDHEFKLATNHVILGKSIVMYSATGVRVSAGMVVHAAPY